MGFLDDYEPVDARLEKFWAQYPEGSVLTELVSHTDGHWLFTATLFRDQDGHVIATGTAHEVETERGVNSTSACENCETSAIGRALANAGFAAKGRRPSREEMTKTAAAPQNGSVDDMSIGDVGRALIGLGLDPSGKPDEIRERLRAAYAEMEKPF